MEAHERRVSSGKQTPKVFQEATLARLVIRPMTDEQKLNGLEKSWLAHLRTLGYPACNIFIQCFTLKLADDTRYSPDFTTIEPDGTVTMWETKGFFRDDAKVKIKVAARQYRCFRFVLVTREHGVFIQKEIKP